MLAKPLEGLVPNVKGLVLAVARARLRQRGLEAVVTYRAAGKPGRVVSQQPAAGRAAVSGMQVELVVGGPAPRAAALSVR